MRRLGRILTILNDERQLTLATLDKIWEVRHGRMAFVCVSLRFVFPSCPPHCPPQGLARSPPPTPAVLQAQNGKHETVVKNLHDLLASLAWNLQPEHLEHLFELFKKT